MRIITVVHSHTRVSWTKMVGHIGKKTVLTQCESRTVATEAVHGIEDGRVTHLETAVGGVEGFFPVSGFC